MAAVRYLVQDRILKLAVESLRRFKVKGHSRELHEDLKKTDHSMGPPPLRRCNSRRFDQALKKGTKVVLLHMERRISFTSMVDPNSQARTNRLLPQVTSRMTPPCPFMRPFIDDNNRLKEIFSLSPWE